MYELIAIAGAQALSSYMSNKRQAANSSAMANYNAAQAQATAGYNATQLTEVADLNASNITKTANTNADSVTKVANYNASIQRAIATYNASLLDNEIARVWEDAELDTTQYTMDGLRQIGHQIAVYASSGVMLGDGGSLDRAIVDSRSQLDMDLLIKTHNAEAAVGRILDERAKGVWQGEVAAQQLEYEGAISAFNIKNEAASKSSTILTQANYDANTVRAGGVVTANNSLLTGSQQSSAYNSASTQSLLDGAFKMGSIAYSPGGPLYKAPTADVPKLTTKANNES